jgi:ribonuclease P protein component
MNAPVLQRLRTRAQFLFVQAGHRTVRPHVLVEARRRAASGAIGVGFTASRAVGGAVIRSRARRRLREAARQLLPTHGLSGVDYVLVARQSTPDAPWGALLDDLQNALIRLRASLEGGEKERPARRRPRAAKRSGPNAGSE